MNRRRKVYRLIAIAGIAGLIAGFVTGTLFVTGDEAWPARGGMQAVFQVSALFSAYCFLLALAVGALLSISLSPLMLRRGLANARNCVLAGALTGLAVHLLVDVAIREPIDEVQDILAGLLAGAAAGLLWWVGVQRHELKANTNG